MGSTVGVGTPVYEEKTKRLRGPSEKQHEEVGEEVVNMECIMIEIE